MNVRGHEYLSYLGQKTQQETTNQAKIDVSEAIMKGEMGAKKRDGEMQRNTTKIDAETKIYSTQRQGERKEEIKGKTEVKIFENYTTIITTTLLSSFLGILNHMKLR